MNIVALIPARAGSRRIPGKNIKPLGGKPLIQWTIETALSSRCFSSVCVSSEDHSIRVMSEAFGARAINRPEAFSHDESPDIRWVEHALNWLSPVDAFAILRPTSPFRTVETIRRAVFEFKDNRCSSIRALERVKQHPGKMWQVSYGRMTPLITGTWPAVPPYAGINEGPVPWHSEPTQSLPTVYVQNSSLEMAWTWCVTTFESISGPKVAPFFTEGWEGFSLDYPEDWDRAERHVADLQAAAAKV